MIDTSKLASCKEVNSSLIFTIKIVLFFSIASTKKVKTHQGFALDFRRQSLVIRYTCTI